MRALQATRSILHSARRQRRDLLRACFSSIDDEDETPLPHTSLFKNPIVHQLWTARQKAKNRAGRIPGTHQATTGKAPSESRIQIAYPFSTDLLLQEAYRNPWGAMRFGKVLEDLDALAGNIAFFHVDTGAQEHPVIVTASVDRIRLQHRPSVQQDQELSGQVTWTGRSSMEIRMQCMDGDCEWLEAYVTFVVLDPHTKKPTTIPPILPQSDHETTLYEKGAARATAKKKRREQHSLKVNTEVFDAAHELLRKAGPLLNLPSLADPQTILMSSTRMQNAMMAQPQVQNLHKRIFGGFLMRRAFELAFSNAYLFGGARPLFLEVDDVSFASPVDVGDLLVFNSRVLYTTWDGSNSIVHIEVEAWVTEPEKVQARISNQFYFTFMIKDKRVRDVFPSTIDEAQRVAMRMAVDREDDTGVAW